MTQHSICQLIGVLGKWELPNNDWPELLNFLKQCFENADPCKKALAVYLTSVLCETSGGTIKSRYLKDFVHMFKKSLSPGQPTQVSFYTIIAMTHLVGHIGSSELPLFQPLIGLVIENIKVFISSNNEDKAAEAMDIFEELFESEVTIVVPHIKSIIKLCLAIAAEPNLDDGLRVKAITFLGTLTRMKKKTIVKHKLI